MFAILLLSSQKSDVICEKLYVYIGRIYVFLFTPTNLYIIKSRRQVLISGISYCSPTPAAYEQTAACHYNRDAAHYAPTQRMWWRPANPAEGEPTTRLPGDP